MSGLEQMRSFFRISQLLGFIPFRMEMNGQTGRFQRFTFSWRYPITWWFVVMVLIQFVDFHFIVSSFFENSELKEMPVSVFVPMAASTNVYFLTILSARFWISPRFTTLHKAVELMQKIELGIKDHGLNCNCTVKRRMVVGFVATVAWIALVMFVSINATYHEMVKLYGQLPTLIIFCLTCLMMLSVGCSFLSLHLVYYLMGYYIRLLRHRLQFGTGAQVLEDTEFVTLQLRIRKTDTLIIYFTGLRKEELMKTTQRLFGYVCEATAQWNSIFALPTLFIIATRVVTVACSLFAVIQGLIRPHLLYLSEIRLFMLFGFSMDCVMMILIFVAADTPIKEAISLRRQIMNLSNDHLESVNETLQVVSFLQQIYKSRLRLSTGLFAVGWHLVPVLTGAIVTYLVILLQTQSPAN